MPLNILTKFEPQESGYPAPAYFYNIFLKK